MIGYRFSPPQIGSGNQQSPFQKLLDIFLQLSTITSGDVSEAMAWMNNLDRQYQLTDDQYGMGDFYRDLKDKGYIRENPQDGQFEITAKSEGKIRKNALEEIFGKLRKSKRGNHHTPFPGQQGDELGADRRPWQFGDAPGQISMTDSLRNAQINHGISAFNLQENDLEVVEKEFKTQTSTVLMIDISHSMILYGEDRITPAKKVAMALAEMITKKYPKDTLDILVFGNDAWQIEIKDLPYLKVGPYHTNTVAGLELAMDLLRRRKNSNKQIFMITDGKPSCLKEPRGYYKNSFGLDRKIVNKCLNLAAQARRIHIPITTFMIASDPYLQQFVREFTEVNQGNAYFSGLQGLGDLVFEDYKRNRRRNI
ncbi:VWA domain-containing protein [Persicobacter sp. CCB-QB2]|uniref:vWA domain-containing protein n=1 Tax=Persicobacter sp. CCB-QB2 TaxID=1561025 RepID=UPI0006A95E48|nr:VWA domain-containing protein [Persicobacter sp. CCB-QB2]